MSGRVVSSIGYMVLQPFSVVGNRLYLELWVITDGLRYPGYKTPSSLFNSPRCHSSNAMCTSG
jgi:hypothetical protein